MQVIAHTMEFKIEKKKCFNFIFDLFPSEKNNFTQKNIILFILTKKKVLFIYLSIYLYNINLRVFLSSFYRNVFFSLCL